MIKRNKISHKLVTILWVLKVHKDSLYYSLDFCMFEISITKARTTKDKNKKVSVSSCLENIAPQICIINDPPLNILPLKKDPRGPNLTIKSPVSAQR